MEYSKEDKFLSEAQSKLVELIEEFGEDNKVILEYSKIISQYERLNKKMKKTMKLGDSHSLSVENKNEKLQKFTKEKLFESMDTQRKLKEAHQKEIEEYKKKSEKPTTNSAPISSVKMKTYTMVESNALYDYEDAIDDIIEDQLIVFKNQNKPFSIAMIGINDYDYVHKKTQSKTDVEKFLLVILKFFKISLRKTIIRYHEDNKFYVIFPSSQTKQAELIIRPIIDKPIKLESARISFSIGLTQYVENESIDDLKERVEKIYSEVAPIKRQFLLIG